MSHWCEHMIFTCKNIYKIIFNFNLINYDSATLNQIVNKY